VVGGGTGEANRAYVWRLDGGAGDTDRRIGVRGDAGRADEGLGEMARTFVGALDGPGDAVSRLSVDDRFMDENGLCDDLRLPLWLGDRPPAFCIKRFAASGFGELAAAYDPNGFLNLLLAFCGICVACWALFCLDMFPSPGASGLTLRFHGW
jgi:hypothetical protein